MAQEVWKLTRDCPATIIPVGEEVVLPAGSEVVVTQALGGAVTVRDATALYRIAPDDLDALGPEAGQRFGAPEEAPANSGEAFSEDQVWEALRGCFDPEIPVNIVDLGLVYDVKTTPDDDGRHRIDVQMTLTARGCGMGPTIAGDAQKRLEALPTVSQASVDIVWDPQWTPHMISPAGREMLGLNE